MADNIDFKNEEFETTAMKPISGEEANVLWGRQMAGNVGHLYYTMPPLLSYDIAALHYTLSHQYLTVYKTLHKPSFFNEIKTYYHYRGADIGTEIDLWIDGTHIIDIDTDSENETAYSSTTSTIGVLGNDEWLVATITLQITNSAVPQFFSFEVFPDWDNI